MEHFAYLALMVWYRMNAKPYAKRCTQSPVLDLVVRLALEALCWAIIALRRKAFSSLLQDPSAEFSIWRMMNISLFLTSERSFRWWCADTVRSFHLLPKTNLVSNVIHPRTFVWVALSIGESFPKGLWPFVFQQPCSLLSPFISIFFQIV